MKPETFGAGEPGTQTKGLGPGLGLSLGVTLGAGLGETLAGSLARTLAETFAPTRDEAWPGAFSVFNLKDLGVKKGAGFGAGKGVVVPTPVPPTPWVLFPKRPLSSYRQT